MSTLILTFQFSSCRFFRQQNPEQGGAKKITEPGSEQKPEQDLRSLDPGAEEQPNPEVTRHQGGINRLLGETLRIIREIRSGIKRSKQEMEYILNQPLTIRHFIRIVILYAVTRILENNPELAEEIIRILRLGPLLLGK